MNQKVVLNNIFRFFSSHIVVILFVFILICFSLFSSFIAIKLKRAIIPDEPAHIILSQEFATSWTFPDDSPRTYAYGPIGYSPYLYYWINGRALYFLEKIIPSPGPYKQLVFLRMINILYSLLTLIFCFLIAKELIKKQWWQLIPVYFLSNTMMFVFLSAGVNYDNLTNALSFGSIYFVLRIFNQKPFIINSLMFLILTFIGTLVKITFLPLAVATILYWVIFIYLNWIKIKTQLMWNNTFIFPLVFFLIFLILNFALYGKNLIKFKAIIPKCNQVLTTDQCNLSPFIARSADLDLPEKLTLKAVITKGYSDPIEYIFDYWLKTMLVYIYGFFGHEKFFPNLIITFFRLFYILVFLLIIRTWKKPTFTFFAVWMIFIFYILVLFKTNYNSEMITGFKHVGIQGRYTFPVIGIFYNLVAYYLSNINNKNIRYVSWAASLILFFIGCPVIFLSKYSSVFVNWFSNF